MGPGKERYCVEGHFLTIRDIRVMADRLGIDVCEKTIRSRLRAGDRTLARLLRSTQKTGTPRKAREPDKDVLAALAALDSRKGTK